jgi:uncharacterized protein
MERKRFIADVMVGRLARYLRMAGYDAAYSNAADDGEILETARREERIVLTRDTMMLKRRDFTRGILRSIYITDDSLRKQLLQVMSCLGLKLRPRLVICLVCNSSLEEVAKEEVKGKVPPYVFKTRDDFSHCRECGRYYWRGTHYEYMEKFFSDLSKSM